MSPADEIAAHQGKLTIRDGAKPRSREEPADDHAGEPGLEPTEPGASSGLYTITLNDYRIEGDLTIAAGVPMFQLQNRGYVRHTFAIGGVAESPEVPGRSSGAWSPGLALTPGVYEVFCTISDHRARGMHATLIVTGTADPPG